MTAVGGAMRARPLARLLGRVGGASMRRFVFATVPVAGALGVQFVTFALTARGLGVVAFGQYAALLGLATIGVELVGIGGADLLVRAVARDSSRFADYFGNMLVLVALSLPPVLLFGWWLATGPVGGTLPGFYVLIALGAEVLIGRISASTELTMVAHGQTARASMVRMATALTRLVVALLYFAMANALIGWIKAVLVQSVLLSIVYLLLLVRLYGRPRLRICWGELADGAAFEVNQTARAMQGNVDRVILARFASDAAVGAYAAGSRVMLIGLFPLQVMTRILYPQFFRAGEDGVAATRRFALRNLPAMVGLGCAASAAVAGAGWFAPQLLGHDFAAARGTAALLGLGLPLIALQYLAADTLTGAGFQHLRAVIFGIAAVGFGLVLALGAQIGGAHGLIIAFLASHALLAGVLWAAAWMVGR